MNTLKSILDYFVWSHLGKWAPTELWSCGLLPFLLAYKFTAQDEPVPTPPGIPFVHYLLTFSPPLPPLSFSLTGKEAHLGFPTVKVDSLTHLREGSELQASWLSVNHSKADRPQDGSWLLCHRGALISFMGSSISCHSKTDLGSAVCLEWRPLSQKPVGWTRFFHKSPRPHDTLSFW